MNAEDFIKKAHLKAAGKLPIFAFDSPKAQKILEIANSKIDVWQNEKDIKWNSLYDGDYPSGTITANTASYELDGDIRSLSDSYGDCVRLLKDGRETYVDTVQASKLRLYRDSGLYCAKVGSKLVFNRTFKDGDPLIGASILVPAYLYAEKLTRPEDIVPVDDPEWLILVTAAEYVRNDIVKGGQYGNLIAEANALMEAMKLDNDAAQFDEITVDFRAGG